MMIETWERIFWWTAILILALLLTVAGSGKRRAEQYSEHLAQELRLCEEGKGKR